MAVTSFPVAPSPHCEATMSKDNYRTRLLDEASNLVNGARLAGPKPSWDSFRDQAGYIALAAELWMQRKRDDDLS